MVIVGVDYSLSSPGWCVHVGDEWSFENCKLFYLLHTKTGGDRELEHRGDCFFPLRQPTEWSNDYDRYWKLSRPVLAECIHHKADVVYVEGYAFGAVGRVFQIAENAGVLKYRLHHNNFRIETPAPTEIKKFATGKGNANKQDMIDAFINETGVDIYARFDKIAKSKSPIDDIVDSYYIAKYGFMKENDCNI